MVSYHFSFIWHQNQLQALGGVETGVGTGVDTGQDLHPDTVGAAATAAAGHPPGAAVAGVTAAADQPAEACLLGKALHTLSAGHLQGASLNAAVKLSVLQLIRLNIRQLEFPST